MGKSGAAILQTKIPDFKLAPDEQSDVFTISGLQTNESISSISDEQINKDTHRPLFSPHIYWNPNLKTNSTGQSNFSFNHTDDVGDFVVIVSAMTADGEFIWDFVEYEVK